MHATGSTRMQKKTCNTHPLQGQPLWPAGSAGGWALSRKCGNRGAWAFSEVQQRKTGMQCDLEPWTFATRLSHQAISTHWLGPHPLPDGKLIRFPVAHEKPDLSEPRWHQGDHQEINQPNSELLLGSPGYSFWRSKWHFSLNFMYYHCMCTMYKDNFWESVLNLGH